MQNTSAKKNFNSEQLNIAVRAITREHNVGEHLVKDRLVAVTVFGVDKSSCSSRQIIDIWDDHCANDFEYDCEEIGLVA